MLRLAIMFSIKFLHAIFGRTDSPVISFENLESLSAMLAPAKICLMIFSNWLIPQYVHACLCNSLYDLTEDSTAQIKDGYWASTNNNQTKLKTKAENNAKQPYFLFNGRLRIFLGVSIYIFTIVLVWGASAGLCASSCSHHTLLFNSFILWVWNLFILLGSGIFLCCRIGDVTQGNEEIRTSHFWQNYHP